MSSNKEIPAYLKLLNLLSAIRQLSPFEDLSADEEQLLCDLAVRWHLNEKITVGELMQESERVSPSTMYRRLIALRDKGFVDLPTDVADRRSRFVIPTASAKKYMKKLDECMDKLMQEK
jgi:DNA-binding MarR family transcriptional regulator